MLECQSLSKSREILEKPQSRALRSGEFARRINVLACQMSDDQRISPLVAPWDHYVQYITHNSEESPKEWVDFMESLEIKEKQSLRLLLARMITRYEFKTIGEVRRFASQKGSFFGIAPHSKAFLHVAFSRSENFKK